MVTLSSLAVLGLIVYFGWLGWKSGAPKDEGRRPGYIERRPDTSTNARWGVHPTLREVRRGYLSVRRARGLTTGKWWPRRPRL